MTIRESSFFTGDTGKLRMLNRKRALRILKCIITGRTYLYSSAYVLGLLIALRNQQLDDVRGGKDLPCYGYCTD